MSKISTSISIDSDVKSKAQKLFADLGMDLSTAVNIFLKQAIYEKSIPFKIQREESNADTLAAIKERDEMKLHPEKYKRYSSFDEFMKEEEEGVFRTFACVKSACGVGCLSDSRGYFFKQIPQRLHNTQ